MLKSRIHAIHAITELFKDDALICNIGFPSQELYQADDKPSNFYMIGSLGLVSSIGLGLSLTCKKRIIVIDGDGSLLMNLGSLATVANMSPENLIWFAIDNRSYGSTGDQRTWTAGKTDLSALAKGAGIEQVYKVNCDEGLKESIGSLSSRKGPLFVHITASPGSGHLKPIPLDPISIRNRFMRWLDTG